MGSVPKPVEEEQEGEGVYSFSKTRANFSLLPLPLLNSLEINHATVERVKRNLDQSQCDVHT